MKSIQTSSILIMILLEMVEQNELNAPTISVQDLYGIKWFSYQQPPKQQEIVEEFCSNKKLDFIHFDSEWNVAIYRVQKTSINFDWRFGQLQQTMISYRFRFDPIDQNVLWRKNFTDTFEQSLWDNC
ncbi:NAD-dependent protein deacylase sirtuin-5 [Sarcoptes scabiei]|nr:NAD-dependent protein deacylase sirtuin-5 [Sarcoptes scabiei]